MRKPRSAKPASALWIVDNRRRVGITPADIARRLDIAESTVRGWESGRGISEQYIADLERIFGTPAPARGESAPDQFVELAASIRELAQELRLARLQQADATDRVLRAIAASVGGRVPPGMLDPIGVEAPSDSR